VEFLSQVLRSLPTFSHPDLLMGSEMFDDAGVFRIDDSKAIVQTVDFFPPLVDDPYVFGQIAAANSLSDVYAMGGSPITAMNIVGFPDEDLPVEVLGDILRGGAERVKLSGAVLLGGHSVRDAEVKYGLSVTGIVHPDRIMTNAGALAGDVLVLTKPIGSGVLTSAVKLGKMPESDLADAIDVMIRLNGDALEAMSGLDVHAVTDVTGFGLLGHAHEMACASEVTLTIRSESVPLIGDTLGFARDGVLTRAYRSTLAYIGDGLSVGEVDESLLAVLADAQTSGGLLIAVSPECAGDLVSNLDRVGSAWSSVIGDVSDASSVRIRVD
jgi:selenide, water dikinase